MNDVTWADKWSVFLSAGSLLTTIVIAIIVQRWTMKFWHSQKRHEINYELETEKYRARLEAAKAIWSLLAYLTEKENGKCLLIYKGTKEKPEVFFDLERGRKYLESVSVVFYDGGHGIFLTSPIKQEIFHIRTNVYRIIDKESRRGNTTGEVLLENAETMTFFRESYDRLRMLLNKYILEELKYEMEE